MRCRDRVCSRCRLGRVRNDRTGRWLGGGGRAIGVSSTSNSGTEAKSQPAIPDADDKKVARAFLLGPIPRKTPGISRMTRSSYPG
jgi:hypothetical protein